MCQDAKCICELCGDEFGEEIIGLSAGRCGRCWHWLRRRRSLAIAPKPARPFPMPKIGFWTGFGLLVMKVPFAECRLRFRRDDRCRKAPAKLRGRGRVSMSRADGLERFRSWLTCMKTVYTRRGACRARVPNPTGYGMEAPPVFAGLSARGSISLCRGSMERTLATS